MRAAQNSPPADGMIWLSSRAITIDSYVTPNAKCPICSARIFYYKSPSGGEVFFDYIGPPWDKHGCSDQFFSNVRKSNIFVRSAETQSRISLPCSTNGWMPLIELKIGISDDYYFVFAYSHNKFQQVAFKIECNPLINFDGPFFFRRGNGVTWEISCLPNLQTYKSFKPSYCPVTILNNICDVDRILFPTYFLFSSRHLLAGDIAGNFSCRSIDHYNKFNAICRICKRRVILYTHESGVQVSFDSLYPSIKPHSCSAQFQFPKLIEVTKPLPAEAGRFVSRLEAGKLL